MAAQPSSVEPTTATSTTSEGPVLSVITKRLRALRKKHNRITQMEESLSQGKALNPEQQEVLRSKPAVLIQIDELERLRQPLSAALDEEITLALEKSQQPLPHHVDNPQQQQDDDDVAAPVDDNDNNNSSSVENGEENDGASKGDEDFIEVVKDLLYLMYFGSMFDVKQQSDFASLVFTRTLERGCCLSYDYVADDATDMLSEMDLDFISTLQSLMISRPLNSNLSHQNALDHCVEHARRWLRNSDLPVDSNSNVTYATLREKLKKIMASGYFTATPQMKGPGEVAAAVAVGNFGSFSIPMHGTELTVEVPVKVEGSPELTEENAARCEEYEPVEGQSGIAEEFHKDEFEPENSPEVVSEQTYQEQFQNAEGEYGYRNADFKDQQYVHRRGQRGGRGAGGRRGYSNGRGGRGSSRGGGPYQNGRNQFYDNSYPRNQYNRRGGRGESGGGGGYYNNSSGAPGNHNQANNGVAS